MKKLVVIISSQMLLAMPALAFEIEEIGKIKATFGSETIMQPTVLAKQGPESSATASLILPGAGFSALSFSGYSVDNKRLGLELSYKTERPDPKTVPYDLTITYSPKGNKAHWTSEGAPSPAKVTFTTLETKGKEGRAVGSFKALLCYAESLASDPDMKNCRPIEGSFDTKIFVGK